MAGEHHLSDVKIGGKRHDHDPPILLRKRAMENLKPMRFVSLHHHSTFSYKDGYQLPDAHVRRANELKMPAIAMTEHGNTDSHVKFEAAAEKAGGAKPIFGCEFYTGGVGEKATQRKYHLTVLARNAEGYRNLIKLNTLAWAEGFYYEPTVSWEMLKRYKAGLVILSGCQGSLLFCSAVGGKLIEEKDASYKRALGVARAFKREFGEWYFVEVQAFPELEKTCQANPILARVARVAGAKLVATMDCHYTMLEEAEVQMILHNIRGGNKQTVEEQAREWGYDVPLCPPPNDRSIWRRLQLTGLSNDEAIQAIVSTGDIAEECNVTLPKLPMVRFPVPAGHADAKAWWEHQLKEGWQFRGFHRLPPEIRTRAKKQLAKERKIMEDKDFIDYMLIVQDFVLFAKGEDAFVNARGSAIASIICYLLRITEVNPLDFDNLVFERFIDVSREDLPDIDIDFPSEFRPRLREYGEAKYGVGCVQTVGTFTVFKNRLALDDVARVYRIPKFEVERLKDFLIERSSGDLRASSTIEDTVEQFPQAKEVLERHPELAKGALLEGNLKGFGVHAAGMVLSAEPIEDTGVCSVYTREVPKGSGNFVQVVSLDKYDAERQGLVKMDYLGLSTASVLDAAAKYLGKPVTFYWDLPLDDPAVFDALRANDVVGGFQLDGRACRYVCGALKPDTFDEICDVIALARPGALHNGAAREYSEIKHGNRRPTERHPAVDAILAPTKYQIVYQEQILRICREVGNFPWEKTAEIRKIIAKKQGEQAFNRRKAQFFDGARSVHKRQDVPPMSDPVIESIWGEMITAGSYGFNAAHARGYGFLAYFTMWLKVHHPGIFYATQLAVLGGNGEKQKARRRDLLRDAGKHGVRVLNPSPSRSAVTWKPILGKKQPMIRAGFDEIEGIGAKTAQQIIEYREEAGSTFAWGDLINVKGIGGKTIEKIEAWVSDPDPFGAFALDRDIAQVKEDIIAGKLGDVPYPTHSATDLPYEQGREFEVVWLGTILARNIRDIFEVNRAKKGEEIDAAKVKDAHLNEWAMLTCEDETDQLLLKIDRWKYPKFRHAIFDFRQGKDLLLVRGVRPRYANSRQIKVKELYVIEP